jgi:thymidine kinase
MKKLYFRYGAMHSGKSMHVITVSKNYELQKKLCLVLRVNPDGSKCQVISRTGLRAPSIGIEEMQNILEIDHSKVSCIVVDEAQFLSAKQVEGLRHISYKGIPVICYGLRSDWQGKLFEGSKRLLELADTIEEVKTTCWFCERKATMNFKISQKGPQVEIEPQGEQNYFPTCYKCWKEKSQAQIKDIK